jgi:hypothetical protein
MNQFLYVQFKVTPKGQLVRATGNKAVTIELPTKHVIDWKHERPHLKLSDEEVAVELTQPVAIVTAARFVPVTHSPIREREIHSPMFLPQRLPEMNERSCDYEDNGIRAWFIT